MYFHDHAPPHFHVRYAEWEAQVGIVPIQILEGRLPRRAASLVFEWAALHQQELLDQWRRAQQGDATDKIPPLN